MEERLQSVEACLLKLVEQSAATNATLHNLDERQKEHGEAAADFQKAVRKTLFGNGTDKPGMVVRLDRLEVSHGRTRWLLRSIVGAILAAAGASVWSRISNGF